MYQADFKGGPHDGEQRPVETIEDDFRFLDGSLYTRSIPSLWHSTRGGSETVTYLYVHQTADANDRAITDDHDGPGDPRRTITDP